MSTIITPNMNLPAPVVGSESGPQYAIDINNSLTLIDQHDHTSGHGVTITTGGLNINSDLTINNNNLLGIKSLRFQSQGAPLSGVSDLGCLYESGVDLYYNDGLGNQVRITQSGSVAGTPGSIANLLSPASASYVSASSTFVFQSDANTAGNIDGGSFILRNLTANSFGLTLSPPTSMSSDYTVTLPNLPSVTSVVTMDASGNMGTQTYDQVATNFGSSGSNIIANQRVRSVSNPASVGNIAISGPINLLTVSTSNVEVGHVQIAPSRAGAPMMVGLTGCPTVVTDQTYIFTDTGTDYFIFGISINGMPGAGGTTVYEVRFNQSQYEMPNYVTFLDITSGPLVGGSITYYVYVRKFTGTTDAIHINNVSVYAYEL